MQEVMQGYEVVAYVGGEVRNGFRQPINVDRVVTSHACTYRRAEQKKRHLERKYGAYTEIRR